MSVTELDEYRAVLDSSLVTLPQYISLPEPLREEDERVDFYDVASRCMDILGGLFGIVLTLPLMAMVAAAVKLTSKGPAVFSQSRVGKDGRLFRCYKFRTMVVNAEEVLDQNPELKAEFLKRHKLDNDPRITPIGNFLRKTSLDELPQFFNVLVGDMGLVGPRPIVPAELAKYGEFADTLVTVRPGLTGLWQVSGRSETTYEERVQLDMRYIAERSIAKDLGIILRTVFATIGRKGAC